ncbi:MAG: hypothetical protein GTN36_03820 [Candidatus Aenigmarchaeota archaeon]|nr:hypothetical protein [Candidatus Aenigmarchaeota archaeon]
MAFILLKLKQNVEEPYAIHDLEKFGVWPFRKRRLIIGSVLSDENDITLIRTRKTKKRKFGEIIKTRDGWKYRLINKKKEKISGIFRDGLKVLIFDNVIEFKEEL